MARDKFWPDITNPVVRRMAAQAGGLIALWAALLTYRWVVVEPRAWVAACAALPQPSACLPRGWLLHAQAMGWLGTAALLAGLAAFLPQRRSLPVAAPILAMAIGLVAVVNQNASWGMLGLALGFWCWVEQGASQLGAKPAYPPAA